MATPTQPGTPAGTSINYAAAVKRSSRAAHTRENGIIIEMVEGIPEEDYVYAITNLTNPTNLEYAFRMSKQRLCIYFKEKNIAEYITINHKTIKINNINIKIRPIITNSKRLLLSNVHPTIPENLLENELKQMGLTLTSNMQYLRAGYKRPELAHIVGSRRAIFVTNDNEQIPEHINITYENVNYQIYITEDSELCTFCRKYGHNLNTCRIKNNTQLTQRTTNPEQETTNQNTAYNQNNEPQKTITTNLAEQKESDQEDLQLSLVPNNLPPQTQTLLDQKNEQQISQPQQHQTPRTNDKEEDTPRIETESQHTQQEKTGHKRLFTSSSNDSLFDLQEIIEDSQKDNEKEKIEPRQNKKPKAYRDRSLSPKNTEPLEEVIKTIKQTYIKNQYSIDFEIYKNILENASGHNNPLKVVREHANVDKFIEISRDIHKRSQKNIKTRLTKLINKIQQELDEEEGDL